MAPVGLRRKTILLVEDNPDDELLALRALRKNRGSNEVIVARDGTEALDYLFATGVHAEREAGILPDLVLLDLKLSDIDGLEVLRRLRANEQTRFLPVVVLTSSREQQDMVQSYSLGANSYVHKPVDFEEFVRAVEQLELYWLTLNEVPSNLH